MDFQVGLIYNTFNSEGKRQNIDRDYIKLLSRIQTYKKLLNV